MNKLSPEYLFVPSQQHVRAILAHYNLPLTCFVPATHGIENLTLLVWSRRKKYVLRVYPLFLGDVSYMPPDKGLQIGDLSQIANAGERRSYGLSVKEVWLIRGLGVNS